MIPIILCSLISVTIILERGLSLRRAKVVCTNTADYIDHLHQGEKPADLSRILEEDETTLGRLVRHCLQNMPYSKYENTEALQTKARAEISDLERGIVILEIVVGIGPLLGLLGTVSGLVTIFGNVGHGGAQLSTQGIVIARGIAEALNTTIAGLVVAIPSLIAHSIYTRRVEGFAIEMESICMDLLGKLYAEHPSST